MRRRPAALLAVWLAGVVVAVTTGVLAVRQVADRVGGTTSAPLSAAGVESELGRAAGSARPSPTAAASAAVPTAAETAPAAPPVPGPASVTRSFSSRGGSIGVSCHGAGAPRLVYATPAQGWGVVETEVEGDRLEVRFRSDEDDARIRVTCDAEGPAGTVEDDS